MTRHEEVGEEILQSKVQPPFFHSKKKVPPESVINDATATTKLVHVHFQTLELSEINVHFSALLLVLVVLWSSPYGQINLHVVVFPQG